MNAAMKYIFTYLLLIVFVQLQAQIQTTIKVGYLPKTIDVFVKTATSFSQKDDAATLVLAIPATVTPAPSLGSSGVTTNSTGPVTGITGLVPAFLVNNFAATKREVVVSIQTINGIAYYVYTFIFSGTAATAHNYTGNLEQLLFSIQFNGCSGNCNPASELAVNLANGGKDLNSFNYFQANVFGNVTNLASPFYSNNQTATMVNAGTADGSGLSHINLANPVSLAVESSAEYSACPTSTISLSIDPVGPGYSYQWQVDNGSGFVNLNNNSNYANVNGTTLYLMNLPSAFYGYKFRAVAVNGGSTITGVTKTLKFIATWNGSQNNSWTNALNWNCNAVPDANTDVIIPTGTPFPPVLTVDASCRSVVASPGTVVTIGTGVKLTITN